MIIVVGIGIIMLVMVILLIIATFPVEKNSDVKIFILGIAIGLLSMGCIKFGSIGYKKKIVTYLYKNRKIDWVNKKVIDKNFEGLWEFINEDRRGK